MLSLISNRIWYEWPMNHNKYRIQTKNPSFSLFFILTLYPTMLYSFSTINELNFLSLLIHHSTETNKRKSKASYSNQLLRIIAKIPIFTGIFLIFFIILLFTIIPSFWEQNESLDIKLEAHFYPLRDAWHTPISQKCHSF